MWFTLNLQYMKSKQNTLKRNLYKINNPKHYDWMIRFMGQNFYFLFSMAWWPPSGPGPPHYRWFTITLRHTTRGRTRLDGWSARRWDLYLTTHDTHKRQPSVPPAGFEPAIQASERLSTHVLDCMATRVSTTFLVLLPKHYPYLWIKYQGSKAWFVTASSIRFLHPTESVRYKTKRMNHTCICFLRHWNMVTPFL
jgi:hypothetical protein